MKQFGKILRFELMEYFKNKMFVGITLFLVAAIAVTMFLPNIIAVFKSDDASVDESEKPVMLIYAEDKELSSLVRQYFSAAFTDYKIQKASGNVDDIKKSILNGDAECAFVMNSASSFTYYVNNLSMYDMNAQTATSVLQEVYRITAMLENGMELGEIVDIMSVQVESETTTLGKDQMENFFYTYIMIFALYMVLMLYGQLVATSVATEKSSRAMELLITSAKPINMMFGKIFAACIAGLTQLLLVFGTAILLYNVNQENLQNPIIASIFNIPPSLFAYLIVFFVLGFLIYAFMYGAIGSTASKLEDISTSVMPITFLFVIAFMVVMISMTNGTVDGPLMVACSYIPFTSPMAMFTRIAMGSVAWYEITASIAILIASTLGIGILSSKIYRMGVLLYGNPPKLGNLIKMAIKKD